MTAAINHTEPRAGKSSAVCQCCGRQSRPVTLDVEGEPDLWKIPRGWSTSPLPASYVHEDGSVGSTYTCPACNKLLRSGATLARRGGLFIRNLPS